jgi:hypothetical protein
LLELERKDHEAAWRSAHGDGEVVVMSPAPPPARLTQELVNRSLFAADRLVLVPDAASYLATQASETIAAELAGAIASFAFTGVSLVLAATVKQEPAGPLADAIAARGELRWLPLPDPPKPWDEVKLSVAQREVLGALLERSAPAVLADAETVEALFATYGFSPRKLVQAAESLAASGEISPEAVRVQAGPGEASLRDLEDAIAACDRRGAARFFGVLAAGGRLVGWRGETIDDDKEGVTIAGFVGRLARQSLAVRAHARRAGLASELDGRRCQDRGWYPRVFKPRLAVRLAAEIDATPASPVAGLSPWLLHRAFRSAAWYEDQALVATLAGLDAAGYGRERGLTARAGLTAAVLALFPEADR